MLNTITIGCRAQSDNKIPNLTDSYSSLRVEPGTGLVVFKRAKIGVNFQISNGINLAFDRNIVLRCLEMRWGDRPLA